MSCAQRRAVLIWLPPAAFFGWIKGITASRQIHTLNTLKVGQCAAFVLIAHIWLVEIGKVTRKHGQDLGRTLLYSAMWVFARPLNKDLEGLLQSRQNTQAQRPGLFSSDGFPRSEQLCAFHEMTHFPWFCHKAFAHICLAAHYIFHDGSIRTRLD